MTSPKRRESYRGGGVYALRHPQTGQVMRVGRTNDLERRRKEHGREPELRAFDFEDVYQCDSHPARRGLEQLIHEAYDPPLDKIAPLSEKNPRRKKYLAAARRFLQA